MHSIRARFSAIRRWLASNCSRVMYAGTLSGIRARYSSRRHQDPPRPPPSWLSAARVGLVSPEAVIPGVDRVVEDVTDGIPSRRVPLELAAIRAGMRPDPEANVVGDQVAEDLANRAEAIELVEHDADDRANLFVGVEIEPTEG